MNNAPVMLETLASAFALVDKGAALVPTSVELTHASYSQVNQHELCAARWYQNKILGIQEAETEALRFGKELHKIAEEYVRDGATIPFSKAGRTLRAGIHLLPQPKAPHVQTEFSVEIAIGHPLKFKGQIDLTDWVWSGFHNRYLPRVTDYKTTSNANYADSQETLLEDWQISAYGKHGLNGMPEAPAIVGRKIFFLKHATNPKAWAVEALFTRERIEANCAKIVPAIDRMQETARLPFEQVPKNLEACDKYPPHGCPYKSRCFTATNALAMAMAPRKRESAKGKTVVPMSTQGFDMNAFLSGLQPPAQAATAPVVQSAPAQVFNAPPSAPQWNAPSAPPVVQAAPVAPAANPVTDPITYRLVNELSEAQIRFIAGSLLTEVPTETVNVVAKLRDGFQQHGPEALSGWITLAKAQAPSAPSPQINPPEQVIAPPVGQVQAALEHAPVTAGKRERSEAESPNEKALRKCVREIGTRNQKLMVGADKAPSRTDNYQALRTALANGQKDAFKDNERVNIMAAEYDARGLSPTAVQEWANSGAPSTPVAAAALPIPPKVLQAAQAQGLTLANPIAQAPSAPVTVAPATVAQPAGGMLVTEMLQIKTAMEGAPDQFVGACFNNAPKTDRFTAFRSGVLGGTIQAPRALVIHEIITSYGEAGIDTFEAAKAYWATGIVPISKPLAPSVTPSFAAPVAPAPMPSIEPQNVAQAPSVDTSALPSAPTVVESARGQISRDSKPEKIIGESQQGARVLLVGCSRISQSGALDKGDTGTADFMKAFEPAFNAFRASLAGIEWPKDANGNPMRVTLNKDTIGCVICAMAENLADLVYVSHR